MRDITNGRARWAIGGYLLLHTSRFFESLFSAGNFDTAAILPSGFYATGVGLAGDLPYFRPSCALPSCSLPSRFRDASEQTIRRYRTGAPSGDGWRLKNEEIGDLDLLPTSTCVVPRVRITPVILKQAFNEGYFRRGSPSRLV